MAHRGRLNVLAHNLGRPYDTIFAEFEGASTLEAVTTIPQGGTGDVKYHHGAQGSYQLPDGSSILVNLESNPSHLEYVGPVVTGATRAAQTTRMGPHAHRDVDSAVPIVLHGDAAMPGQGVVPGDAQPAGARRLLGRRHAAPDPEQPGRLHDRSRRLALHALGVGHRQGLRRADHPRQRRRRRGLRLRRPAGLGVPPRVRPRRRDRPDRLPPLRPQRGRRARLHPARAGRAHPPPQARRRPLGRAAHRPGRRHQAGRREREERRLGGAHAPAPAAQGADQARGGGRRGRPADGRVHARPHALAGGQDRGQLDAAADPQRRAAAHPRGLHGAPQARQAARAPPRRRSGRTAGSTGRTPSRWRSRRC